LNANARTDSRNGEKGGTHVELLEKVRQRGLSRRGFLAGLGGSAGAAAALAVAGCGGNSMQTTTTNPSPVQITDADVLNFALNLEYLEAEYYLFAATGAGLSDADAGTGAGAVTGGAQVMFQTPAIQQYAMEIANDELAHVRFLRSALGSAAVSRPAIDLTNSFNAAAMAAGIGPSFNPFADEDSFIVGAFVFEDVGVTAYHGAAGLLTNKTHLSAAAGIMAVEAYHAAEIRTLLVYLGGNYVTYANQISALRAAAGGGNEVAISGSTIVAGDSNSIAFDRTTDQVLHIVYLNATAGVVKSGGFYPDGMNGTITATAS
jgi:Ferritin-like domain